MTEKQKKFLDLFEPVKDNLWRFCLTMSKNRENAKDLLQETITIAFNNFDKLSSPDAFLSWLFTIASRKYYEFHRKKLDLNESVDVDLLFSKDISPEEQADIRHLYDALSKLPDDQRESIVLSDIMGYSREEICKIQDIELETLKSRLYRGRKKLIELLRPEKKVVSQNEEISWRRRNEKPEILL